jgi:hypothetical protein
MAPNRVGTPILDISSGNESGPNSISTRQSKLPMPLLDKKRKAKEISPNKNLIINALHNAVLALERAQNTINDNNMRNQIEQSINTITKIINDSANTQTTSESAVEQKMQAKFNKLHEEINAKFDQIIKIIENAYEKSTQIP